MLRVFHPGPWPAPGGAITLEAAESAHLVRVRRARAGERVVVLDGRGGVAECSLAAAEPKAARLRVEKITRYPAPPARVLAVGLPKGGVFMEIVRQAVELGATEVHPLLTARGEARFEPVKLRHKLQRWRNAAVEACKQSGNPWLTIVSEPVELMDWLKQPIAQKQGWLRLVAALTPEAKPLDELLTLNTQRSTSESQPATGNLQPATPLCSSASLSLCPCVMAIGPEGDFTSNEYAAFKSAGFQFVRLPGHVLRVETACVAALANLP